MQAASMQLDGRFEMQSKGMRINRMWTIWEHFFFNWIYILTYNWANEHSLI